MKTHIIFVLVCFFAYAGKTQNKSILLLNGTAHIGNGEVINNSAIVLHEGKITMVANALVIRLDFSKFDTVINIEGKHVYPGFIGANNIIGLTEIESTRSTLDFNEAGAFNPNVRAQIAYNTDSRILPTIRSNGVLLVQSTPRGGVFSGTSSIMTTAGWNWEDATVKADDGVHLNWPYFSYDPGVEPKKATGYSKKVDEITAFLREAKAYCEQKEYSQPDVRFESLRNVFLGKATLFIHCNFVKEITDAVVLCRELKIEKKAIVGGHEAHLIAGLLNENNVAVMLRRVHELPMSEDEEVDLPYRLPYLLHKAGILFCIQNEGDQEAPNLRNLPFQAGTSAAYGLTKEEALSTITLNVAKILGIDKLYGSIEVEKSATLFVSEGDALDMRTNNIIMAWINGEQVDLDNYHKEMYRKYTQKYLQQKK